MSSFLGSRASRTLFVATIVLAGLAGLAVGTRRWLEHDRRELAAQLARDRASWLRMAAQGIEEDMQDIVNDLRYFGAVVGGSQARGEVEHILTGSLGTVNPYHTVAVYGAGGAPELVVTDPLRASAVTPAMLAAMHETAAAVLAEGGPVVASSPSLVSGDVAWLRVFATRLPGTAPAARAIALLVDTHGFLSRFRLIASDPHTEILFVGPDGTSSPISSAGVARAYAGSALPPGSAFAGVVADMRRGATGTVTVTAGEAAALGLGAAEWIAAYTGVRLHGSAPWSVASFTSLAVLNDHEARVLWRVTCVAAALAVVLVVFGAYVVIASNRTAVLRERLRYATEIQQLQTQLIRAEKLSAVGVIAAGIAHEVGTPLGIVRARAELTAGRLGGTHPLASSLGIIVDQTDQIVRIISELLDFARTKPLVCTAVDVEQVVHKSVELLRFEATRREVALSCEVAAKVPPVAADAGQLQQVMVNLMLNAFDACARGGCVVVRAAAEPDARVRLEVEDDGCGIEAASLPRVFDAFFTTKPGGRGTGLGLSVVTQIARTHGAQIDMESSPGRGTRVILSWPVAASAALGVG